MKGIKFQPRKIDHPSYTTEEINGEIIARGDGVNYGGEGAALSANLTWTPVRPNNPDIGHHLVLKEIDSETGATLQSAADAFMPGRAFAFFLFDPVGPCASGTLCYESGALFSFRFDRVPVKGNYIKAYYFFDEELCSKIPKVELDIYTKCPSCGKSFVKGYKLSEHPHQP